ncbi:hypothetical protein P280DRAFT_293040 [Massarina eburnea CBS 473.64]|uniref:Uncharacterized protein n=1 Tax=Massarina eburnea CBS 473.64 TaxID=1395130 RepID=A0A6A6S2Q9_9PLEO|nr:hypothetical protein P280DRAFT_293040 [Massarina eburnea CBS 473.64]
MRQRRFGRDDLGKGQVCRCRCRYPLGRGMNRFRLSSLSRLSCFLRAMAFGLHIFFFPFRLAILSHFAIVDMTYDFRTQHALDGTGWDGMGWGNWGVRNTDYDL